MKLHQFEALVAVVDHGGIRAAARALNVSQAAVTKSMRLLEDDVGTLRVGLTPFLNFTALGETFSWFRQRYRNVQLQLIEGLMLRVLPKLRDGTLDIAAVAADVGESGC